MNNFLMHGLYEGNRLECGRALTKADARDLPLADNKGLGGSLLRYASGIDVS